MSRTILLLSLLFLAVAHVQSATIPSPVPATPVPSKDKPTNVGKGSQAVAASAIFPGSPTVGFPADSFPTFFPPIGSAFSPMRPGIPTNTDSPVFGGGFPPNGFPDGTLPSIGLPTGVLPPNNLLCNNNGVCNFGESCITCPNDCQSYMPVVCGDGICVADQENCITCPADCMKTGDFCCGITDGVLPNGCGVSGNSVCFENNKSCVESACEIGTAPSGAVGVSWTTSMVLIPVALSSIYFC